MGEWLNLAFVGTNDLAAVEREVRTLVSEYGRAVVTPSPRTADRVDQMQYGRFEEVARWGIAGFPGVNGWTALRAAPFELLMRGDPPLLARLAARLRAPAFQYNVCDGSHDRLFEVDSEGRTYRSGWGHDDDAPAAMPTETHFGLIDVMPAVAVGRKHRLTMTGLLLDLPRRRTEHLGEDERSRAEPIRRAVDARFAAMRTALTAWLDEVGGTIIQSGGLRVWRAEVGDVVTQMARPRGAWFLGTRATYEAVPLVFGGERAKYCTNSFLVETLVPHASLPVEPAFVVYADRAG